MPPFHQTVSGNQQHAAGSSKRSKGNGKKNKPSKRSPTQPVSNEPNQRLDPNPPTSDVSVIPCSSACSSPVTAKTVTLQVGADRPMTSLFPGDAIHGEVLACTPFTEGSMHSPKCVNGTLSIACQDIKTQVPNRRSVQDAASQTDTMPTGEPETGAQNLIQQFIDKLTKERKCFDHVHLSIEEELNNVKSSIACSVCMSKPASVLFLSCSHLVCCESCSGKLVKCPVCRSIIRTRLQVYMI